jgi:hypothetical protein
MTIQPFAHFPSTMAFIDVAIKVIAVAWIALAILVLGLLAASVRAAVYTLQDADDVVFTTLAGLDERESAYAYRFFKERSHSVAIAYILAVVLGPLGAYAYLGQYGKAAIALVTLNGFGAWWIESWFSVPQVVVIAKRKLAEQTRSHLAYERAQPTLAVVA